jgi:molybdopterin-guanine dinucleotide biosynthesis protein A
VQLNYGRQTVIVGVVLAGGLSTRMGKDKAQLRCSDSGLTLLQRAERLLAHISPDPVLLSSNLSSTGIKDVFPQCGPLSGIHASSIAIREQFPEATDAVFIPVDMPFLNEDNITHLIECGRQQQRPCCYKNCYLPLYLPLNADVFEYLHNTLLSKGNYSLRQMMESLNGLQVTPNDRQNLININKPHEWQEFELNGLHN